MNQHLVAPVVKSPLPRQEMLRDMDLIPGLGQSLGEGNGNSLQHSCPENSMERGAWRATVYGATKSQTQLSMHIIFH